MSGIDNGADYGKLYLFLGKYDGNWQTDADNDKDGQITSSEFLAFINNANWDTDTLGNRPENDIIGNFFSKMLDENNISQHYLDQSEMAKVFTSDKNGNGNVDWKEYIQKFAESIGISLGADFDGKTLEDIDDIASVFKNHSYVKWGEKTSFDCDYNANGYTIRGLVKDSKNMTFEAKDEAEDLTNVNFNNGTLTFNAPALDEDKTYTITITAKGADGSEEIQTITVKIGAKPKEEKLKNLEWNTSHNVTQVYSKWDEGLTVLAHTSINIATNVPEGTTFEITNNGGLTGLGNPTTAGVLSFQPFAPGTYTIQVTAKNGDEEKTQSITITINPAEEKEEKDVPVTDTTKWTKEHDVTYRAPLTKMEVCDGVSYSEIFPASDYPAGTEFTIPSETLPEGVNYLHCDPVSGEVTFRVGELTENFVFSFEMQATLPDGTVLKEIITVKVKLLEEEDPEPIITKPITPIVIGDKILPDEPLLPVDPVVPERPVVLPVLTIPGVKTVGGLDVRF